MRKKHLLGFLLVLAAWFSNAPICVSEDSTPKKLQQWVTELGDSDLKKRKTATHALIDIGRPAIKPVSEAVGSPDTEVHLRARKILTEFFESDDDQLYRDALSTLRELTQSKNPKVVRTAYEILNRPKRILSWIKKMDGEFTVNPNRPEQPVIELQLDRTRGIDPGFHGDPLKDVDLQRLKILREIRLLTLEYRTTMTDSGLQHLAKLKKLESLNLSRTDITGSGLSNLVGLSNLKTLNLASCARLNEEGFRNLGQLKQLRALNLNGTTNSWCNDGAWMWQVRAHQRYGRDRLSEYRGGITDPGLRHVCELDGLTSLSLEKTRITNAGLSSLKQLTHLESLDLSRTVIDDEGLEALSEMKNLKKLRLNFTPISDRGLGKLKNLRKLEELQLQGTPITDAGLRELAGLKQLRSLDLQWANITDASIDVLKELPQLNDLNVHGTKIRFSGLFRLSTESEHFDLESAFLAGGLARADEEGNLVALYLDRKQLQDADLKHLRAFDSLRVLSLRNNPITDRGLSHLSSLNQLRVLELDHTPVTNEGLRFLKDLDSLVQLGIQETQVTYHGVLELFTILQKQSLSEALHITNYFADERDYPCLDAQESVRTPENLAAPGGRDASLQLMRPGTSPEGLKFLDVSNESLTDADVARLRNLENLGALFLQKTRITDRGVRHLVRHKNLEVLWVGGPEITGQSLALLSELPQLHTLWLTDTGLSDGDLVHLPTFPELRILNLYGANITDAAIAHLQKCQSLRVLIVEDSVFSEAALAKLRKALPKLFIQQSQARILAEVRGRARQTKILPRDPRNSREEIGLIEPVVDQEIPMLRIFGDAHFERAKILNYGLYGQKKPWVGSWTKLTTLTEAVFINTDVSDEVVAALRQLPHLKHVNFARSRLNMEALALLSECDIEELNLGGTAVTDGDLAHLVDLKKLQILQLDGTSITDAGLTHLRQLSKLRELHVLRTSVSEKGEEALKRILPGCKIFREVPYYGR